MTRRKWTSDEQEDWLKARLSSFTEAQAKRTTTSEFFPKTLAEWRKAWPVPEPTADELAKANNVEDALKKKRSRDEDRVKAWFHNHSRGSTSGTGARGVLKLKTKSRVLHEWQVYYRMTYESQWKAVIEKEWETYKEKLTGENPEVNLRTARFNFGNEFIREKYQAETEEVKAEVKKRREREEEDNMNSEAQNKSYQKAIDKLPATLAMMGKAIESQTGWNITFLVGGPEPINDGKIMTYMFHCGKSPDGQDFEAFLGNEKYEEHITDTFDDFLHKAFPQNVRDSRRLASRANTPESGDAAERAATGNGEGTDDRADESDGEKSVRAPRTSIKSQYELTREANIAKNKEILEKLEVGFPAAKIEKKPRKKASKREKAKNESEKHEPSRFSTRIQGTSVVGGDGEEQSVEAALTADQTPVVEGGAHLSSTLLSATSPSVATPSGAEVSLNSQSTALTGMVAHSISPTLPLVLADDDSPRSFMQAPVLASASTPAVDTNSSSGPVEDASSLTPPTAVVDFASSVSPVDNSASFHVNDASSLKPPAPTINSASVPLTSNETDESAMDVDSYVDKENAVKDKPMLGPESVVRAYNKNMLPAWLIKTGMLDYLHGISQEKAWQDLVETLITFEMVNTTTGNLPVSSRPNEVAEWIKSKKKDIPREVDPDTYGSAFMTWWIAIQPEWRLADDSSFIYVAPVDEDWRVLHKGGSAGLYTVVVALSWWVRALTPEVPSFRAWTAVRDVQWVIDEIYKKIQPQGKKRGCEDGGQATPKGKRHRSG